MKSAIVLSLLFIALQSLAADELPHGVPRVVNPDGTLWFIDNMFTTREYQQEAFRLLLEEANRVALDLQLSESHPITESNIVDAFICPFGYAYKEKAIGNITTTNYWYNARQGNKFSNVTVAKYDEHYVKYRDEKYKVPANKADTNSAYCLAIQWLTSAGMDIKSLNRDCKVQVNLSTDMEHDSGKKSAAKITPIYFVSWIPKTGKNPASNAAYVELFLPARTLLQLSVNDAKYILRPPLVFTNLEILFPGEGKITTNYPSKPIVLPPSFFGTDNGKS